MSAYASIAVEKWKCLFRIVTYAFVTVVGIDKGEVYLAIEATVPFFTINQNLSDSVGFGQKWSSFVGR